MICLMRIIKDIEQGTDEWLKLRLGIATASNFSKIITGTGKESASLPKYALELATELLLIEPEQSYKSEDMIRGNELEQEARIAYEQFTFNAVDQVTFVSNGDWGCSPDGLVGGGGVIEIKCPKSTTHAKYIYDDKLPTEYVQQVQGVLMSTQRNWCDFVSYHPNFCDKKKLFIKRVIRDEEYIKKLRSGIEKVIEIRNNILIKLTNESTTSKRIFY